MTGIFEVGENTAKVVRTGTEDDSMSMKGLSTDADLHIGHCIGVVELVKSAKHVAKVGRASEGEVLHDGGGSIWDWRLKVL